MTYTLFTQSYWVAGQLTVYLYISINKFDVLHPNMCNRVYFKIFDNYWALNTLKLISVNLHTITTDDVFSQRHKIRHFTWIFSEICKLVYILWLKSEH